MELKFILQSSLPCQIKLRSSGSVGQKWRDFSCYWWTAKPTGTVITMTCTQNKRYECNRDISIVWTNIYEKAHIIGIQQFERTVLSHVNVSNVFSHVANRTKRACQEFPLKSLGENTPVHHWDLLPAASTRNFLGNSASYSTSVPIFWRPSICFCLPCISIGSIGCSCMSPQSRVRILLKTACSCGQSRVSTNVTKGSHSSQEAHKTCLPNAFLILGETSN